MPLETADTKVKEICELLRKETLEPAKREADLIIEKARNEADELIRKAKEELKRLEEVHKKELQSELQAHQGSLQVSVRQSLSALRQGVEALFVRELEWDIQKEMGKEEGVAKAINVIFSILERDGIGANLQTFVPEQVNIRNVVQHVAQEFQERVQKGAVPVQGIKGGALVRVEEKKFLMDLTDQAMKELLASFVIPELKEMIFSA